MKLRDYIPPEYFRFLFIEIEVDGKWYELNSAIEKIPDHEITEEQLNHYIDYEIDSFFQHIEEITTESELKAMIFEITEPQDFKETRKDNILLLFDLIENSPNTIEAWKNEVILGWAKRFVSNKEMFNKLDSYKPKAITISSKDQNITITNHKRGARYAVTHFDEIKKILSVTGNIVESVRKFDPSLSKSEVENVRRKVSFLLKEEGLVYPYRQ